ncbi:HAMP domain-containing histidine kinase [Paenibacillus oenotherae]|uniref:histidine kinase n=1 Tax=Paenibacillus oenotherae TaxID=1435645 RepID=A0ABS7DB39_9BACL|nr:HAMP domain-containing sensor histidine kinase [Paenibacillus oenotherae]MBW7477137.1 HAMP domain-containing histidine kinase [Paenibacillus oenotherae]
MVYIVMLSMIAVVILFARLLQIRREMRRVAAQLRAYNEHQTEKKIDLAFFDKGLEELAVEINRHSELTVQANARRRRTEDELKQAVASMSHDIRTPLTSIFGYIQLLESDDLSAEDKREYLSIINNRAKRLQVLLNDFFELSVIESIDYPMKLERLKLNHTVMDVLVNYYDLFNERNVEPVIALPEEDILLITDDSAVKRVVENLIVNAINHSNGSIAITLEKTVSGSMLTVSNAADQLKQEHVELLFNRFYTADLTRSGNKGTGLGLSIAQSLMLRMNGKLTASLEGGMLHMRCQWTDTQQ